MDQSLEIQNASKMYAQLRKEVETNSLMKPTYRYYILTTLAISILILGSMTIAFNAGYIGLIIGSLIFGFIAVQAGFVGHDAAHMAISKNNIVAQIFGQFSMSFVLGMSYHYWWERHNAHHAKPNDEHKDPDIEDMPYAYSENGPTTRRPLWIFTSKWQEYSLFTVPFFVFFFLRVTSWMHIWSKRQKSYSVDVLSIALHLLIFLALPIYFAGLVKGIIFYVVWTCIAGFYFGLVFIPNHLGMPTVTGKEMDFLNQQTLTSRDIRSPRIVDFFYGGLNYQIEHHLFPTMSRKNLYHAKPIVKKFCEENNIRYHEPNVRETYVELLTFSRKIGLTLRKVVNEMM